SWAVGGARAAPAMGTLGGRGRPRRGRFGRRSQLRVLLLRIKPQAVTDRGEGERSQNGFTSCFSERHRIILPYCYIIDGGLIRVRRERPLMLNVPRPDRFVILLDSFLCHPTWPRYFVYAARPGRPISA